MHNDLPTIFVNAGKKAPINFSNIHNSKIDKNKGYKRLTKYSLLGKSDRELALALNQTLLLIEQKKCQDARLETYGLSRVLGYPSRNAALAGCPPQCRATVAVQLLVYNGNTLKSRWIHVTTNKLLV